MSFLLVSIGVGTTSAHAENTAKEAIRPHVYGNYLRARGEYKRLEAAEKNLEELPPRTRRIPEVGKERIHEVGTTSAHAENTKPHPPTTIT